MRKLVILLAALAVASCQSPSATSAEVAVHEFGVEPSSSRFEAGTITLDVKNEGEYGHTLVISDAGGHVLMAGAVIDPGLTSRVSIDLDAGVYSFTCRIVAQDDDGVVLDHYEQGMLAEVVVGAG